MRRTGRFWLSAVLLLPLLLAVATAGYFYWAGNQRIQRGLASFTIAPGSGVIQVARDLRSEGVVTERWSLIAWAYALGHTRAVRAGEYRINANLTLRELLELFVRGDVIQYSVTFIEGWTFAQMRDALARASRLVPLPAELSDDKLMEMLDGSGTHPEGQFFPDTYTYVAGTTAVQLLQRARTRMQTVLAEEWAGREANLPLASPAETLVLASIIEKETGLAAERAEIAAVFHNRLRKGMRLQTDPTVIYGLGPDFDGNLTRRHLRSDTPYNTYTRAGLPPTPIAMPGREAIHAALHPADSEALYFVAKGDGSHAFSKTLEQHNRAVIRYQLGGKPKPFSSYSPR